MGGNLAASSQILLRKCKIDYCIIGDGEIITNNLISYLIKNKNPSSEELNKISGICFLMKIVNLYSLDIKPQVLATTSPLIGKY